MSKYMMFIDETGTSEEKLTPFTVSGVIIKNNYLTELGKKIEKFKMNCFGRSDFIFHLKQIVYVERTI